MFILYSLQLFEFLILLLDLLFLLFEFLLQHIDKHAHLIANELDAFVVCQLGLDSIHNGSHGFDGLPLFTKDLEELDEHVFIILVPIEGQLVEV